MKLEKPRGLVLFSFCFFHECHCIRSTQLKMGLLPTWATCTKPAGRIWALTRKESLPSRGFPWLIADLGTLVGPDAQLHRGTMLPWAQGSCGEACLGEEKHFTALDLQEILHSQWERIITNQQGHTRRAFPSKEYLTRRAERQRKFIKDNWWVVSCHSVPFYASIFLLEVGKIKSINGSRLAPEFFWEKKNKKNGRNISMRSFSLPAHLTDGKYFCSPMFLVFLHFPESQLPLEAEWWLSACVHL